VFGSSEILAISGVIPPFLLLWLAERFERRIREPAPPLRYRVLVASALVSVPVAWTQQLIEPWLSRTPEPSSTLLEAFVLAASVEEGAKVACLYVFSRGPLGPRTRYGAFLYALHASMGFALIENVVALLRSPDAIGFTIRFILRAYLTVPLHLVAGGLVGYLWSRKRFDGGAVGLAGALGLAVLLHGSFNSALLAVERLPEGMAAWSTAAASLAVAIPLLGAIGLRLMGERLVRFDHAARLESSRRGSRRSGRPPAPDEGSDRRSGVVDRRAPQKGGG